MIDERVQLFLQKTGPVLCLDIGSLTQKAILARPGIDVENWPSCVLPSNAALVSQRIMELALLKRPIWLYGKEMGGGFAKALRAHLALGLPVYATEMAAVSLHDNLEAVTQMGVEITELCPRDAVPVHLGDYNPGFWESFLRLNGLPQSHMTLACLQDHGNNIFANRQARGNRWQEMLAKGNDPINWIYGKAPENMKRLSSLQSETGGPVADSAVCAILGALCDERVFQRSCREGVTVINVGNAHTVAALIYKARVFGIYEHHTDKRNLELLREDLKEFRLRWLPAEKTRESGGQGTAYAGDAEEAGDFEPTFIMGPRRDMLKDLGDFMAPHGDMPHAGCFGLLYGWARAHAKI